MSTTEQDNTLELLRAIADQSYPRDYNHIPIALKEGLQRYVDDGCPVGDFLQAVIANDFLMAVGRADMHSLRALPAIACWVYNEMPAPCHGSRAIYKKWILWHKAKRGEDGKMVTEAKRMLDEAKADADRWDR